MQFDLPTLESAIAMSMEKYEIPGLGIAIVYDDSVIYQKAFGTHRTLDRPALTLTTPMQGASLSKPVMAYLAMKLVERQVIDLHTPLFDYWSDPLIQGKFADKITAYHVLTHTTGFPNWRDAEVLRTDSPVGETFGYSGEGFELLQHVVEQLTGQPLYVYAKSELFDPLGMEHTSFAWGLDRDGEFLMDEEDNPLPINDSRINGLMSSAAFSILTTASDYAKFLVAMLNPRVGDSVVLDPETLREMLTPRVQVGDRKAIMWGLGWAIQQIGQDWAFWHWGGAQNHYANYVVGFPRTRLGVVIMTNSSHGFKVHERIAQIALHDDRHHTAFEWLLPIEDWSATG